jgi:hypothetical protein
MLVGVLAVHSNGTLPSLAWMHQRRVSSKGPHRKSADAVL